MYEQCPERGFDQAALVSQSQRKIHSQLCVNRISEHSANFLGEAEELDLSEVV